MRAGVKQGDVIVAIDGAALSGSASAALASYAVGASITFGLASAGPPSDGRPLTSREALTLTLALALTVAPTLTLTLALTLTYFLTLTLILTLSRHWRRCRRLQLPSNPGSLGWRLPCLPTRPAERLSSGAPWRWGRAPAGTPSGKG